MQAAKVNLINTDDISPNPHNPRRLFDEEPMRILKESVEKLGILVPVTLYQEDSRDKLRHYVLLDGERRWRCAQSLNLPQVPAIVVERPDDTQNILTMFHIHNVREGWQLMPTALKLQMLMKKLNERNERILAELTKLSIAQIRRCKILLGYPKRFQEMMLAPTSERMKADFFIELDRIRRPALEDKFPPWRARGDAGVIQILLDKYLRTTIAAVTDFRKLAEIYKAAREKGLYDRMMKEFDRFLDNAEMTIEDMDVPGATFAKEVVEIRRSARRLISQLDSAELEALASDPELVSALKSLMRLLKDRMDNGLLIGVRDVSDESDTDNLLF